MTALRFHYIKVLTIFLTLAFGANSAIAQGTENKRNDKATIIQNMIAEKKFVFKARLAQPTMGRTVQLTSNYDLRVSGDTVQAYLPYFGRAYSAPIGVTDGGIRFTSTNFDYKETALKKRKGGWSILIEPKDTRDVQQLILQVFNNGSASLQVISTNRQPISFTGAIVEKV